MSRELTRYLNPIDSNAEAALDSADPRLLELADLVARRAFTAAADKAAEVVEAGIYDIRALVYVFYDAALRGGFGGLADLFGAVENLIGPSFEAIGPATRREEHFDKRLAWLFGTLSETLAYEEAKKTPEWRRWQEEGALEQARRAIENSDSLSDKLAERPFPNAMRSLGALRNWLRTQVESLAALDKVPAAAPPDDEGSSVVGDSPEPEAVVAEVTAPGERKMADRIELTVSPRFIELCARLEAFETLVGRREFLKAAYLADEIQHTLEDFDPRLYFPEVFARYSELLANNIEVIAEYWEQKDTIGWKALGQFCQVNLKGFVEG